MDKANIIISIIIVLCIAAAVAAYGITNSDNPIFSDLSSIGANDNAENGIGNNTIANQTNPAATDGSSNTESGSGSGSTSGGSSSSSSGSSSNGGSSSNSGSNSNSGGNSHSTQLSYSAAKAIADDSVLEEGCYAGEGYHSHGYWIFPVYDADGNQIDAIGVDDTTGMTSRV